MQGVDGQSGIDHTLSMDVGHVAKNGTISFFFFWSTKRKFKLMLLIVVIGF